MGKSKENYCFMTDRLFQVLTILLADEINLRAENPLFNRQSLSVF